MGLGCVWYEHWSSHRFVKLGYTCVVVRRTCSKYENAFSYYGVLASLARTHAYNLMHVSGRSRPHARNHAYNLSASPAPPALSLLHTRARKRTKHTHTHTHTHQVLERYSYDGGCGPVAAAILIQGLALKITKPPSKERLPVLL